jgi:dinuclear metal center YbgI/SA1388 family protein
MKLNSLITIIDDRFQSNLADTNDFTGIQLGDPNQEIKKVLVALEVTSDVVEQAIDKNVDLIIVHHPFIFRPIQNFTQENYRMKLMTKLIKNDISLYVSHSPIDKHVSGINNYISDLIGLNGIIKLEQCEYGVKGDLKEKINFQDFNNLLKSQLKIDFVKTIGSIDKIQKVAIIAGDGDKYSIKVLKNEGVDVLITGDIYYHTAVDIEQEKLCVIDIGHNVEKFVIDVFEKLLTDIQEIDILKSSYSQSPFKIV